MELEYNKQEGKSKRSVVGRGLWWLAVDRMGPPADMKARLLKAMQERSIGSSAWALLKQDRKSRVSSLARLLGRGGFIIPEGGEPPSPILAGRGSPTPPVQ
jgi:hypothetical protein